jgi:hypothetical protein
MARFITTIQLHNADENDYKTLNAELKKASFVESKRYFGKRKSDLPAKEEYNREGNVTIQQVTDAVLRAAAKTGKKYSFTVVRNKPVYT